MPADQAELHRRAVEAFGARVRAVADDQWQLPTPCSDWNVRQLVNHLVYENRWTVPLMDGGTIAEVGDRYEGDLLGDRPQVAWEESSAEAVASVQADGALDRTVDLSSGPTRARGLKPGPPEDRDLSRSSAGRPAPGPGSRPDRRPAGRGPVWPGPRPRGPGRAGCARCRCTCA